MNEKVKVLVISGFGLNCEKETAKAFSICGAECPQIHLNDILNKKYKLDPFHILVFIGGFSFGDHLGAGTVFANKIKFHLRNELENFIAQKKLILGICNGFQTLTRLGLVPALNSEYFKQESALAHNDSGVFRDDWVYLKVNKNSPCIFTRGIDRLHLPIRHGEGKFAAEEKLVEEIEKSGQAVIKYADSNGNPCSSFPDNPNGSLNSIAGICDPSGRVFGLMPHPEAFLSPYNDPNWTEKKADRILPKEGEGVQIFRNAVQFAEDNLI